MPIQARNLDSPRLQHLVSGDCSNHSFAHMSRSRFLIDAGLLEHVVRRTQRSGPAPRRRQPTPTHTNSALLPCPLRFFRQFPLSSNGIDAGDFAPRFLQVAGGIELFGRCLAFQVEERLFRLAQRKLELVVAHLSEFFGFAHVITLPDAGPASARGPEAYRRCATDIHGPSLPAILPLRTSPSLI